MNRRGQYKRWRWPKAEREEGTETEHRTDREAHAMLVQGERADHEERRADDRGRWLEIKRGTFIVEVFKQAGAWIAWVSKVNLWGHQTPCCEGGLERIMRNARHKPSRSRAKRAALRWLYAARAADRSSK